MLRPIRQNDFVGRFSMVHFLAIYKKFVPFISLFHYYFDIEITQSPISYFHNSQRICCYFTSGQIRQFINVSFVKH